MPLIRSGSIVYPTFGELGELLRHACASARLRRSLRERAGVWANSPNSPIPTTFVFSVDCCGEFAAAPQCFFCSSGGKRKEG
jgi:hypothetical protein